MKTSQEIINKVTKNIIAYKFPIIFFALLSIIAAFPVLLNFSKWGQLDWDQHTFYHAVPRKEILSFSQFPLWNPYYCGGSPLLANPQSTFLSPLYLLILFFGEIYGLKLQIFFALFIGMLGMYFLSRQLGYTSISSYAASIIFMLSSWFSLRVNSGHTVYFNIGFMPFVMLFFLKSLDDIKYIFLASLFMSFIIFGGAIYPLIFIILILSIYALFLSLQKKTARPLINLLLIYIMFFLISSIKLLPLLEFTAKSASQQDDVQFNSLSYTLKSLIDRSQKQDFYDSTYLPKGTNFDELIKQRILGNAPWGWHEYGAYIGLIPLIILLLSLLYFRKKWPLVLTALILFILALGDSSIINLWSIIHKFPIIRSLHGPSRFITAFVFIASLLIGYMLSQLEKKESIRIWKKRVNSSLIICFLLLIITIDLILVALPLYSSTFDITPPEFSSEYVFPNFMHIFSSNPLISQYPNFLQNLGTIDCYERVHPPIKAAPAFIDTGEKYPYYNGETYIAENNQTQSIIYFSPNKIKVKVNAKRESNLVLNQNYDSGWKAKNGEIFSYKGLIATKVDSSDNIVEFYYLPNSFIYGLIITIISLIAGIYFYFNADKILYLLNNK